MKKNALMITVLLAVLPAAMAPLSSFAVTKINVAGKASIVLVGTASPQPDGSVKLHVTGATKNAKALKNTDIVLRLSSSTKITRKGARISVSTIPAGRRVKVFGIYDRKTNAVSAVTWIKVIK